MTKTIPEQLTAALAELSAATEIRADASALVQARSERDALAAENAALKAKLADAETFTAATVKKATDDMLASLEKRISARAEDRVIEIMARVGQPMPIGTTPNSGGEVTRTAALNSEEAVAAHYREKHQIS